MASKTEYEIDSQIAEGMEGILADAIRKHPVLYAKGTHLRCKSLRPEKESDAWNQISDELNLEVESCKSLWSCIKQKFIKYRKRLDNGETFTKEWVIYDNLQEWLDEHIKKRRTRNDIFKQIRAPIKPGKLFAVHKTSPNSSTCNESEYLDDVETAEWNEIPDDKDDSSKLHIVATNTVPPKRRILPNPTIAIIPKKKLKLELIQDCDEKMESENEEIFTEIETTEVLEPAVVDNTDKPMETVEIIKESEHSESIELNKNYRCGERDIILEANFDKLEAVIAKCVNLAEKCMAEYSNQDSNEVFGKFVASLVRDLPAERRMKVQLEIIQFTGQLIQRESNK